MCVCARARARALSFAFKIFNTKIIYIADLHSIICGKFYIKTYFIADSYSIIIQFVAIMHLIMY